MVSFSASWPFMHRGIQVAPSLRRFLVLDPATRRQIDRNWCARRVRTCSSRVESEPLSDESTTWHLSNLSPFRCRVDLLSTGDTTSLGPVAVSLSGPV